MSTVVKTESSKLLENPEQNNSGAIKPMPMKTRSQKVFFQKDCFQRTAENILLPPLWGKKEKMFHFPFLFLTAAGGAVCFFSLQIVNTLIKSARATMDARSQHKTQPTANPLGDGQGQRVQMTTWKISGGSMVWEAIACRRRATVSSQT